MQLVESLYLEGYVGKIGTRVFILEDHRLLRLGLKCDLEEYPMINVVGDSQSAEEALLQINLLKPNVVIVNPTMSDMDVVTFIQRLQQCDSTIKILILAPEANPTDIAKTLTAGVSAYCLKSTTTKCLVDIIHMIMEGGVWLDQQAAQLITPMLFTPVMTSKQYGQLGGAEMIALTERESEILELLVKGKSNTEIAHDIFLSVHTVKSYVSSIFQKLCVDDRVQASVKAVKVGLVKQ